MVYPGDSTAALPLTVHHLFQPEFGRRNLFCRAFKGASNGIPAGPIGPPEGGLFGRGAEGPI
jgi:hypothetical protein